MFSWALKKILGTKNERELKRMLPVVEAINGRESALQRLSDAELAAKTAEFKQKLANGAPLDDLLIDAFAVCREASRRVLGMRHFDVQLIGGQVLHSGKIAEMKTGEGKTLVGTLPCYLNALEGKGVHVVTVNDYLARRDAEWMGRLYGFLGLSTGVVVHSQGETEKKRAYRSDITYGQNNEFGFDYLRDNMKFSIYDYDQRELNFAIVDEVDSILIDEARTPLIISGPGESASEQYMRVNEIIPRLRKDEHFVLDEKQHSVTLTEEGVELTQKLLRERDITKVENLYEPINLETLHIFQQLLRAHSLYKRDQHYMVTPEGKILIIDEFTGRALPGRRWSDGLHQAVEAKEHVPVQQENRTLATISFQNLFRLYKKLAGMTGTADTEAEEFHKIYKLDVVVIPTNRSVTRVDQEDLVYKSEREKFKAVAKEIAECRERGQPVLVGTTSVEKSDALSRMLDRANVPHNVLNAKQHEREAFVVAQAGRKGAVTVATNMAGRGTDILLGGNPDMLAKMDVMESATPELLADPAALKLAHEAAAARFQAFCEAEKKEVLAAGGLHILGTERHESRRIDNQLRGRSGRQGDPGSSRFYLSLEDELMRIFAGDRIQTLMDRMGMEEDIPIEHKWVTKAVENAQKKVEERNFDTRKHLLEYDDVMNEQRKTIYALRRQILEGQFRHVPVSKVESHKSQKQTDFMVPIDRELQEHAKPLIAQMVKHHGAPVPPQGTSQEELIALRERAQKADINQLTELRLALLEQDVYAWFGCAVSLTGLENKPKQALDQLNQEVPQALSEQKERLLDLVDELSSGLVEQYCPENRQPDDWDLVGLQKAFEKMFGIKVFELRALGDRQDIATKLFKDAEAVILNKMQDIGPENFLRLFRNFYLQEIDRQWLEHLSQMDHLRDGIGLRGYGQKDPKKEYKKEGYDLFVNMMQNIKSQVGSAMFGLERVSEEDVARVESQRRQAAEAQVQSIRMNHPDASGEEEDGEQPAPQHARARQTQNKSRPAEVQQAPVIQVKRERPKVGRNDPCWCGSGKKYKQCHLREDQLLGDMK